MVSAADVSRANVNFGSLDAMFSDSTETMCNEKIFNLGRVSLLLNLLKGATDLEDDVRLGIARKLGWLFDVFVDEDVFSAILALRIPMRQGSGNQEPNHHPVFCILLYALKTFMITVSSSLAWNEIESFLIENLFHPHFLCWEIITELWCFLLRHADTEMVNDVIDKICSLLRSTSSESALFS